MGVEVDMKVERQWGKLSIRLVDERCTQKIVDSVCIV